MARRLHRRMGNTSAQLYPPSSRCRVSRLGRRVRSMARQRPPRPRLCPDWQRQDPHLFPNLPGESLTTEVLPLVPVVGHHHARVAHPNHSAAVWARTWRGSSATISGTPASDASISALAMLGAFSGRSISPPAPMRRAKVMNSAPVHLGPRQGRKQMTGFHGPAVHRQAPLILTVPLCAKRGQAQLAPEILRLRLVRRLPHRYALPPVLAACSR